MFEFLCKNFAELLEKNVTAPYKFIESDHKHIFKLLFTSIEDCLPKILQLYRASLLKGVEKSSMIAAIEFSRHSRFKFSSCCLEDFNEIIAYETVGRKITPLVANPGRIVITNRQLYFQPFNDAETFSVYKIKLTSMQNIVKRRYMLKHVGLEILCDEHAPTTHLYLALASKEVRDDVYQALISQTSNLPSDVSLESVMHKWQKGDIDNFQYLQHLNFMADRSLNDITQYPVYPWVISDYSSSSLDLNDSTVFRDLSLPMGCLNQERLQSLQARYQEMPEPKFLYGSHYSTPGFVLFYLVRKCPQLVLCLQGGRFDHPDRMFNSVSDTWKNALNSTSDFKELIPEFYDTECRGEFLTNFNGIDFGHRSSGKAVQDVALPPWASGPEDFINKLRCALESDHVSNQLHHWIDLIFGYKQRGEEAIKHNNVFFHLCYEGSIDLESVVDHQQRHALEVQITEFGQIPCQLFKHPHPPRTKLSPDKYISKSNLESTLIGSSPKVVKELVTHHKDSVTQVSISEDGCFLATVSLDSTIRIHSMCSLVQTRCLSVSDLPLSSCQIMPDNHTVLVGSWSNALYIYDIDFGKIVDECIIHDDVVSCLQWTDGILATGSWDSTIKIWSCSSESNYKVRITSQLITEVELDSKVTFLNLSQTPHNLVAGTSDGCVSVWDLQSQTKLHGFGVPGNIIVGAMFCDNGNVLTLGSQTGVIQQYDLRSGQLSAMKNVQQPLSCLEVKDKYIICGCENGYLWVWDTVYLDNVMCHKSHNAPIKTLAVHENMIVSSGDDQMVVLLQL